MIFKDARPPNSFFVRKFGNVLRKFSELSKAWVNFLGNSKFDKIWKYFKFRICYQNIPVPCLYYLELNVGT